MESIVTVAVFALVAVRLISGVRHSRSSAGRSLVIEVWRAVGWRHVWPVPLVMAGVVVAASLLMRIPGFDWGWWSLFGGSGSPISGSSSNTVGTFWEWLLPMGFIALLAPALPLWAHAEERIFRRGAEEWSAWKRCWKTVGFGLIHAIVGVPIGVAAALSVGGTYFMVVYLRRWRATMSRDLATLESTCAHTMYNAIILLVVFIASLAYAVEWIVG